MNSQQQKMLYLVVTGAPLTQRAASAVTAAEVAGWRTAIIASPSAESWLDDVQAPILTEHRGPSEAKRLPPPEAVLMAPATFNSVNKLATGIADTYALSVMCEALSRRVPTVLVPFVSTRLAGHPAWLASLAVLRYAGVTLIDPRTGAVNIDEPIESGTGDAVAGAFDWNWPLRRLTEQIASS